MSIIIYCREQKILVVNVIQTLVRLSQIKKFSLPDYAHVNKVSKKMRKK
jgi:hypothetical protein